MNHNLFMEANNARGEVRELCAARMCKIVLMKTTARPEGEIGKLQLRLLSGRIYKTLGADNVDL